MLFDGRIHYNDIEATVHNFILGMSSGILFPTNEYTTASKSPQQIQQMILPDEFRVEDTLAHIVNKGLPPQLPYLYTNMHRAFKVTLTFVCDKAPQLDPEHQLLIASSFRKLLELQAANLTSKQLQLMFESSLECLNNLQSSANQEFGTVMEAVLRNSIDRVGLLRRMENRALQLGKASQPIISKVGAARMVCLLSKYGNRTLKGQMVEILKRVVADSEVEARKIWLSQFFPSLLSTLDIEFVQLHFQEKLFEAVWDQNEQIDILALKIILSNANKFSLQERSSRIVKLFIDALTSKGEKMAVLATELMGSTYQKLLGVIMRKQEHCMAFWRAVVELSQSKNQTILNNLVYNLPGILSLAAPMHRVDPLCDIYAELFYSPIANKQRLASYYHIMAQLFPGKADNLRQLLYWMMNELLEDPQPSEQAIKVINKIIGNIPQAYSVFVVEHVDDPDAPKYFDNTFCEYFLKYLNFLLTRKISRWIEVLLMTLSRCHQYFSPEFLEIHLVPRLYSCVRMKLSNPPLLVELMVRLIVRDCNSSLINSYVSKVAIELGRSSRSFERESALLFFYTASHHMSLEAFAEYRLGQKYLHFYNDKYFKVRALFVQYLPRMVYFLNKEETIQYAIIMDKMRQDTDPQMQKMIAQMPLEDQAERQAIKEQSTQLRVRQKQKTAEVSQRRQQANARRSARDLKRQQLLRKRNEVVRVKTNKIVLKQVNRKKVPAILTLSKANTQLPTRK